MPGSPTEDEYLHAPAHDLRTTTRLFFWELAKRDPDAALDLLEGLARDLHFLLEEREIEPVSVDQHQNRATG